jgi:hypothetical protein
MRFGPSSIIPKQNTKICKVSSNEETDNVKIKGQNLASLNF